MELFGWICWIIVSVAAFSYGCGVTFFFTMGKALGGRNLGFGQLVGVVIIGAAGYSLWMAYTLAPFRIVAN